MGKFDQRTIGNQGPDHSPDYRTFTTTESLMETPSNLINPIETMWGCSFHVLDYDLQGCRGAL